MDYLWTPWRYSYITTADVSSERPAPASSASCCAPATTKKSLIVHRGEFNFIILNAFPYTSGHSMIVPYEHVDRLHKLPEAAAHGDDGAGSQVWRRRCSSSIVPTA